MKHKANPIVRVAVEPEEPADLAKLQEGLRLLYLSDPAVEISVQENGEQIIGALGEMHLTRCISLLSEEFAKIKVKVSTPIVSFRESIVKQLARNVKQHFVQETAERMITLTVRAIPLPWSIVQFLESNQEKTKRFIARKQGLLQVEQDEEILSYRDELAEVFKQAGERWNYYFQGDSKAAGSRIWAFGPRRVGPNILINEIPNYASSRYDFRFLLSTHSPERLNVTNTVLAIGARLLIMSHLCNLLWMIINESLRRMKMAS